MADEDPRLVDPYGVTEGEVPEEFDDEDSEVNSINAGIQRAIYGLMGPDAALESMRQLVEVETGIAARRKRIVDQQLEELEASSSPTEAMRTAARQQGEELRKRYNLD